MKNSIVLFLTTFCVMAIPYITAPIVLPGAAEGARLMIQKIHPVHAKRNVFHFAVGPNGIVKPNQLSMSSINGHGHPGHLSAFNEPGMNELQPMTGLGTGLPLTKPGKGQKLDMTPILGPNKITNPASMKGQIFMQTLMMAPFMLPSAIMELVKKHKEEEEKKEGKVPQEDSDSKKKDDDD